jgi:hypothetical protein
LALIRQIRPVVSSNLFEEIANMLFHVILENEKMMKTPKSGRHAAKIKNLAERVLEGPGQSDARLRQSAAQRAAAHAVGATPGDDALLPPEISRYVDKLALHAYGVSDTDIASLRMAGHSEDVIFELTLSAALSAGMARLKIGLAALTGEDDAA